MVLIPVSGAVAAPSATRPIRALVVARRPLEGLSLARLLSAAPLSWDVETAGDLAAEDGHDLVVFQVDQGQLPEPGAEIRPRLALVVESSDPRISVPAIRSGARAVFTRDTPVDEFLAGLSALVAGFAVLSESILLELVAAGVELTAARRQELSRVERLVYDLIVDGRPVAEIAAARGISQKTVRNHTQSIYRKLGVRNRTDAVRAAGRVGPPATADLGSLSQEPGQTAGLRPRASVSDSAPP